MRPVTGWASPVTHELRHRLDGAHASLRSLRRADVDAAQPLLDAALRDLGTALEELDVAVEELAGQNDALAGAQREIDDERRRYRELFEEAPESYVVTDAAGIIERANQRALRLVGAPAASVVGVPLAVFVPLDDRVAFRRSLAALAAGPALRDWRGRMTRRGAGGTVPVAVDATPSVVAGEVREIRWLLRDISQLTRAQEAFDALLQRITSDRDRLEDLDAWKNAFIAAAAHDLRGPIAAIAAIAAQLLAPATEGRDMTAGLRTIVRESDEVQRLLGDLLDLDRFTRGVVELRDQPVDLAALVRDEADRMAIRSHDVELDLAAVAVRAEAQRISQIVNNLLRNAVQHTPDGTKVWVRTVQTTDGALIVVDDAGPGLPTSPNRHEIFAPFVRAHAADAGRAGTGIGLSLVTLFAQLHGGRAWAEPRSGGGASFTVFLPTDPRPRARPPAG